MRVRVPSPSLFFPCFYVFSKLEIKLRNLKKPSRGKWPNKLWHDYKISREHLITSIFEEAERLNLNDLELAKEAKLAPATVYNLDNYITIEPRETTIWKLARAVGMKVEVKKERVQLKLKRAI